MELYCDNLQDLLADKKVFKTHNPINNFDLIPIRTLPSAPRDKMVLIKSRLFEHTLLHVTFLSVSHVRSLCTTIQILFWIWPNLGFFSIHFYGFQFQNFPYISLRTFPYPDTYQLCYSRTLVKNIWLKKTKKGLSTYKIPRLKRYQVSKSCRRHLERGLKADQVVKLKTKKFPVIYTSHFKCLKQNFFVQISC